MALAETLLLVEAGAWTGTVLPQPARTNDNVAMATEMERIMGYLDCM